MTLSVSKTITMSSNEVRKFKEWIEKFECRAISDDAAKRNIKRALKRKFGFPGYRVTSIDSDLFRLNLGKYVGEN